MARTELRWLKEEGKPLRLQSREIDVGQNYYRPWEWEDVPIEEIREVDLKGNPIKI